MSLVSRPAFHAAFSVFPRHYVHYLGYIIQKTKTKTIRHSTSTVLAIPKCRILLHKPEEKMLTVFEDVTWRSRTNFSGDCCLHGLGFLIVTSMGTSNHTNGMRAFVVPRHIRVILKYILKNLVASMCTDLRSLRTGSGSAFLPIR
jgi:hypothetical protein